MILKELLHQLQKIEGNRVDITLTTSLNVLKTTIKKLIFKISKESIIITDDKNEDFLMKIIPDKIESIDSISYDDFTLYLKDDSYIDISNIGF